MKLWYASEILSKKKEINSGSALFEANPKSYLMQSITRAFILGARMIILAVMLNSLPDPGNWASIDAYPCVGLFFFLRATRQQALTMR
jgi:hypothetical protein